MADEEPGGEPETVERSRSDNPLDELRASRRMSWILDECIRVPGTQIRFGLDPILGLVPYGGETVASIFGAFILGDAGKKGLPIRTLAKMGGNMMINATVGAIPGLGDLFSVWFKSNSRNYRMMNTYLESDEGEQESGGWWPLLLIVFVISFVVIVNVLAWVILTKTIVWLYGEAGALLS